MDYIGFLHSAFFVSLISFLLSIFFIESENIILNIVGKLFAVVWFYSSICVVGVILSFVSL